MAMLLCQAFGKNDASPTLPAGGEPVPATVFENVPLQPNTGLRLLDQVLD
jgi:hypothetical protein